MPDEALVPIRIVEIDIPASLECHDFLPFQGLLAVLGSVRTIAEHLAGIRKGRRHRKVRIERIGKEDAFVLERLHPPVVRKAIGHLVVGQRGKVVEFDVAHHDIDVFAQIVSGFGQRFDCRPDRAGTTLHAPQIEIERRSMRNLQPIQQPPEMIGMTRVQRDGRRKGRIERDAHRLGKQRRHDPLGVAFAENDEPREVQFLTGPHGEPYMLASVGRIVRQCERFDRRGPGVRP